MCLPTYFQPSQAQFGMGHNGLSLSSKTTAADM